MNFSHLDYLVIVAYFLFLLVIGFVSAIKSDSSTEGFLLAGRMITLPGFVVTLVTTWYGGILAVGEYSYSYGISNWLALGFPYYIFAIFFALFLSKKIRESNLQSIPDQLEKTFGRSAGIYGAFITFFMVSPAPYALMSGILLSLIFPTPLWLNILIALIISLAYVLPGGYKTLVNTDYFQFALMFLGFGCILPIAFSTYGGLEFLELNLPKEHLEFIPEGHGMNLLVWFFIASWTLVDPGFYQRCFSAKNPKVARNGILISVLFWMVFDILTTSVGLYAKAIIPNLTSGSEAYPALGDLILPPILKGLFFTGLLATVISTLNGYSFLSAQTMGKDILMKVFPIQGKNEVFYTRYSMVIVIVITFIIAIISPTVVDIWFNLGSVLLPGILLPMMCIYFFPQWIKKEKMLVIMIMGSGTSVIWYLLSFNANISDIFSLSPFYPGMLMSLIGFILFRRRNSYNT